MKKTTAALATGLIFLGGLVASPAANAATTTSAPTQGIVIAQDTTRALEATPSSPRAITIHTAPDAVVRIKAQGEKARKAVTDKEGFATIRKLTAGREYAVSTPDSSTTVTPVVKVGRAENLRVTTTDRADAVRLTWDHAATRARGGNTITYTVAAEPIVPQGTSDGTEPVAVIDEVGNTEATLIGLDPSLRYSFSVTPQNALGAGEPSVARMNRSLSAITGLSAPVAAEDNAPSEPQPAIPAVQPAKPTPAPAPNPAPNPGPAPAPKPSTKTIYVCPDGFADNNGVCTKTMGYTYATQDYTYHRGKVGTEQVMSRCSSGYTDDQGNFHWIEQPHDCWVTQDVMGDIKDATPAGWEDTGSNWRKKDDTPAGWSDDGSQWIQTTGKVAKVVSA